MLKFIKKHNSHIELGISFIPDGITFIDTVGQENEEKMPED